MSGSVSIICEYHSIEEGPKLLRSCSKPHLSSLFLRELAQTVAGFPSEFTNTEHTHPRAARGFSDSQWVSCSPFKAITMYQSILFARGKTGKVKNDAMPPKVGRVALDRKRVFHPSQNDSPLSQNMDEPWAYVPHLYCRESGRYNAMNGNLYCIFSTEKCSVIRKRGRQVEVASKFHPEFFGLNVRRNGPQPRTFVRSFSQITSNLLGSLKYIGAENIYVRECPFCILKNNMLRKVIVRIWKLLDLAHF